MILILRISLDCLIDKWGRLYVNIKLFKIINFLPVFERYLVQRGTGMPSEVTVDENLNIQYIYVSFQYVYIDIQISQKFIFYRKSNSLLNIY